MAIDRYKLIDLVKRLRETKSSLVLGFIEDDLKLATFEDTLSINGGTRVGKGAAFLAPSVSIHPGPVVVTSMRDDARNITMKSRQIIAEEFGGECFQLVFDSSRSDICPLPLLYWDPVKSTNSWSQAKKIANSIVKTALLGSKDPHWGIKASALFASMLYVANYKNMSLSQLKNEYFLNQGSGFIDDSIEIANRYDELVTSGESLIREDGFVFSTEAYSSLCSFFGEGTVAPEERASIHSCLTGVLDAIEGQPGIDCKPIDFEEFINSHSSLYITFDLEKVESLSPFTSAFISELSYQWRKQTSHLFDMPMDRNKTLLLALDETLNISPIPDLPRLMHTAGGDGIQIITVLQSAQRAMEIWGKAGESLFADSNFMVFPGRFNGNGYFDYICNLAGKETVELITYDVTSQYSPNIMYATKHLLIAERIELENILNNAEHNQNQYQKRNECLLAMYQKRQSLGLVMNPKFASNGKNWADQLFDEIMSLTKEVRTPIERNKLTPEMMYEPGDRKALLVRGASHQIVDARRYYDTPFWQDLIELTTNSELRSLLQNQRFLQS